MQKTNTKSGVSVRVLAINAMVMALYIALSLILPFSSGQIQFRMSESLNHLVVFNRKYIWGVFAGVVVYNLFWGFGPMDVIFGGGQTLLALLVTAFAAKYIHSELKLMLVNIAVFTVSMFMIAIMLTITAQAPFWLTYGTTAVSEFIIMSISAPIMYFVNKQVKFGSRI